MDRDQAQRQAALRARADEAMAAALAAADARAPVPRLVVDTALGAVRLVCWDANIKPRERLSLIDDAIALLNALKELPETPPDGRADSVLALLRRTNELLKRYADLRVSGGRRT